MTMTEMYWERRPTKISPRAALFLPSNEKDMTLSAMPSPTRPVNASGVLICKHGWISRSYIRIISQILVSCIPSVAVASGLPSLNFRSQGMEQVLFFDNLDVWKTAFLIRYRVV